MVMCFAGDWDNQQKRLPYHNAWQPSLLCMLWLTGRRGGPIIVHACMDLSYWSWSGRYGKALWWPRLHNCFPGELQYSKIASHDNNIWECRGRAVSCIGLKFWCCQNVGSNAGPGRSPRLCPWARTLNHNCFVLRMGHKAVGSHVLCNARKRTQDTYREREGACPGVSGFILLLARALLDV